MKLEGGERLEKEKKRKRLVYNPPIRTQLKPPGVEENVVRNPMTWWEKKFGRRMKSHTPPKCGGISHAPIMLFLYIFFNYFKTQMYLSTNMLMNKKTHIKIQNCP